MKSSKTIKLIAAGMLFASPLLWSSCADTWGEHYDVTEGGMADQPSLLQNLSADPDLANFYKTLVAIGASDMLNSSQQFTIWAPVNFTAAQADSVIAVYNAQKDAGFKQEDNKAITQFLYNHTAMYSRPISSVTNDTVRMMNDKYMHLIGTSASSGSLNTNPFNEMITCNNGIIYKTAYMQTFFPNVREYIEQTQGLDSVLAYIRTYDEYELDETASVPGGVVDGKTVYLDSVTYLHNNFLSRLDAQISREDSNYTVIVPTNEVWNAKYEKIREYYRYYSPDPEKLPQANGLSSAENYCKNVLLQSCFFNTSESSKYNKNPKDSLCNTMYYERQQHWPRRNVLYNTGDLLADMEMQECSNGRVYIDHKGVFTPELTYFYRSQYDAYSPAYYEVPKDAKNEPTMNVSTGQYVKYTDTTYTEVDTRQNYLIVTSKSSSEATRVDYNLTGNYSNVYYNIYLVTVPDVKNLPMWFRVGQSVRKTNGDFTSVNYFTNPHIEKIQNGEVANYEEIIKQSKYETWFVNSTEKIDTILVQSAVKYDYCGVGLDNPEVKLTVSSIDKLGGQAYREKIYTRTLSLGEIIMIPFATEAEAKAAADNLDAFNDKVLQEATNAKKE